MNAELRLLTSTEVAQRLQCSTAHVRALVANGLLKSVRIGSSAKSDRFHPDDIENVEWERKPEKGDWGTLYFIQAGESGPVKIGFTKHRSVAFRMASLQTACPYKLILRAAVPGTRDDEQALHVKLKRLRLHGEWFAPKGALAKLLNEFRLAKGKK